MKCLRVPWIRCRADEIGAISVEMEWRNRPFTIIAHTERDAKDWWCSLSDDERNESLGFESASPSSELSLF